MGEGRVITGAREGTAGSILTKTERKRLQNRLNQQAYRKREAEKAASTRSGRPSLDARFNIQQSASKIAQVTKRKAHTSRRVTDQHAFVTVFAAKPTGDIPITAAQGSESLSGSDSEPINADTILSAINANAYNATVPKHIYWEWAVFHPESVPEDEIQALELGARGATTDASQRTNPALRFPLSPDHKIMVVQYNLYRAMKINKELLSQWLPPCPSSGIVPRIPDGFVAPHLQPTALQQILVHPAWVANFPHPKVRDNLVLKQGDLCWEDMFTDLIGYLYPYHARCERDDHEHQREGDHEDLSDVAAAAHGLIVWGEPWDFRNWEVTPAFVRKWRWTLKGCQDLIEASNRWRAMRNEPPILEVMD